MRFGTAFRKEWLEQLRSYRLLVTAVVLTLFGLLSPLIARYTPDIIRMALPQGEEITKLIPPPSAADSVAQYLKNITQFGVLLALLMAMGLVAQEKDKGTAALMMSKPMSRQAFILAKFASLALTFTLSIALAGAAGYYYTLVLFGSVGAGAWLGLNAMVLVFLLVYVSLTLLCSTLTKSQVLAGGLATGVWIILSLLGALPGIGDYSPRQLIGWATSLGTGASQTHWPALGVSLALVVGGLAGACAIFNRQEL
jgi:ABC-2 type transport system permease protein